MFKRIRDWFRSFRYWKLYIDPDCSIWLSKKGCKIDITADEMAYSGSSVREKAKEHSDWWTLVKK